MTLSIAKPFVSIFKKGKSKKSEHDDINGNSHHHHDSNYIKSKHHGNIEQNSNYLTVNHKQKSYTDNDKIEETYTVLYQVYDENSCRGASPQLKYEERVLKINEEGVFLFEQEKLVCHWGFSLIKEFSLDENWTDWIVILRDSTKHYFKSYESIQIHLKINDIIRKLISQIPSSSSSSF
ncbi:hypothetical protein ACTFIZ_001384 [Dictyostelium cf. discoideum]